MDEELQKLEAMLRADPRGYLVVQSTKDRADISVDFITAEYAHKRAEDYPSARAPTFLEAIAKLDISNRPA